MSSLTQDQLYQRFADGDFYHDNGRVKARVASGLKIDITQKALVETEKLERLWVSGGTITWPRILAMHAPANELGLKFIVNADGGDNGDNRLERAIQKYKPSVQIPFSALDNADVEPSSVRVLDWSEDLFVRTLEPLTEEEVKELKEEGRLASTQTFRTMEENSPYVGYVNGDNHHINTNGKCRIGYNLCEEKHLEELNGKQAKIVRNHQLGACVFHSDDRYFLSAISSDVRGRADGYFLVELPRAVKNLADAYESLRPSEINKEWVEGTDFLRQGEYFFVKVGGDPDSFVDASTAQALYSESQGLVPNPVSRPVPINTYPHPRRGRIEQPEGSTIFVNEDVSIDLEIDGRDMQCYVVEEFATEEERDLAMNWEPYVAGENTHSLVHIGKNINDYYGTTATDLEGNVTNGNPHNVSRMVILNASTEGPTMDVQLYVNGSVTHPEHLTTTVGDGWYRVYHNTAKRSYAARGMVD